MKRILVVGGAGYLGGITTDFLIKKGNKVVVYDKLLYESRFLKDVDFIYGDVRDTKKLLKIHKKYDEIIWLAAIVGDGACLHDPLLTREVNVDSVRNFLDKAKRKIIFISTCSVYGKQDDMLTEKSPTKPLSIYASTKLESEGYVLANGGLVLRLGTLFGLADNFSRIRLDLVVNLLTMKAYKDKEITIFGGKQWRPLLAVKDVASYLVESTEKDINGIYNLKFKNYTINGIAKEIKETFGDIKVHHSKMKYEDVRSYKVDSSKADKTFSFQPRTTIKEEAKKMRQLFKDNRIKNLEDSVYYNAFYVKDALGKKFPKK